MEFKNFFKETIQKEASDLHLVAGSKPIIRINGSLVRIDDRIIDNTLLKEFIYNSVSKSGKEKLKKEKELDSSIVIDNRNFRVNFHYQRGKIALAARLMPERPPKPEDIGLTEIMYELTHLNNGLILVTGAAGVGKSTTLATMLDIINQERRAHIITIEDPIEFNFEEKQSLIEQREVNLDTLSFASALKYSLRQDPNVIMVGEMRDLETIQAALTAAATGHLVISTLHTSSAAETISRIINVFPSTGHTSVLSQLSNTLRAVISQQLLPTIDGKRIAAREIMINTSAISTLIRSDNMGQIYSTIETSAKDGMITMNKSIEILEKKGIISADTANKRKRNMNTKSVYY